MNQCWFILFCQEILFCVNTWHKSGPSDGRCKIGCLIPSRASATLFCVEMLCVCVPCNLFVQSYIKGYRVARRIFGGKRSRNVA